MLVSLKRFKTFPVGSGALTFIVHAREDKQQMLESKQENTTESNKNEDWHLVNSIPYRILKLFKIESVNRAQ